MTHLIFEEIALHRVTLYGSYFRRLFECCLPGQTSNCLRFGFCMFFLSKTFWVYTSQDTPGMLWAHEVSLIVSGLAGFKYASPPKEGAGKLQFCRCDMM